MSGKGKINNKSSGSGDLLKLKKRNAIVSAGESKPSISNYDIQQTNVNTIGTDSISLVLWQKGLNINQVVGGSSDGNSGVNPIVQVVSTFLDSNTTSILPVRSAASRTFFTALDNLLSNQTVSTAFNINTPTVTAYYTSLFSTFLPPTTPIAPSTGFYALSSTNVGGVQTISQSAIRSVPPGGFILIPSSYPVVIGNYSYTVNSLTNQISYTELAINVTTGPLTVGSRIPLSFPGSASTAFTFLGAGSSGVIVFEVYRLNPDIVNTYTSTRILHRVFVTGSGGNIFAAYTSGSNYYITNIDGTPFDLITGTGAANIDHLVSSSNGLRVYAIGSTKSGGVITNKFISNLVTPPTLTNNLEYRSLCTDSTGANIYVCVGNDFIYKALVTYNPDDIRQAYSTPFTKVIFNPITPGGRFGTTIRSTDFPLSWTSIACSSDGTFVVACASGNYLYLSKDSGSTWLPLRVEGITVDSWRSVSMSGDGRTILAITPIKIFISQDFGSNFRNLGLSELVDGITTSWFIGKVTSDGSQVFVSRSGGRHYIVTTNVNDINWTYFLPNGGEDNWTSFSITNDRSTILLTNATQNVLELTANSGYIVSSNGTTLLGVYGTMTTWLPFPTGITSIASNAFLYLSDITGPITIPNTVTSIGSHAFAGCSGITGTLTLPTGLTSIQPFAFFNCKFTGPLVIPNNVTSIGSQAFNSCDKFTSLTLSNTLVTISTSAFGNCSSMVGTLTIPNTVNNIGEYAFYNTRFTVLRYNTDLTINTGTIGANAFQNSFIGQPMQYIDLDYLHNVDPTAFPSNITIYRYARPEFRMYTFDQTQRPNTIGGSTNPANYSSMYVSTTRSNVGTVLVISNSQKTNWQRYRNPTITYKVSSSNPLRIVNINRVGANTSYTNNPTPIPAVTDADVYSADLGTGYFNCPFPRECTNQGNHFVYNLNTSNSYAFLQFNQTFTVTLKTYYNGILFNTLSRTITSDPTGNNANGYGQDERVAIGRPSVQETINQTEY